MSCPQRCKQALLAVCRMPVSPQPLQLHLVPKSSERKSAAKPNARQVTEVFQENPGLQHSSSTPEGDSEATTSQDDVCLGRVKNNEVQATREGNAYATRKAICICEPVIAEHSRNTSSLMAKLKPRSPTVSGKSSKQTIIMFRQRAWQDLNLTSFCNIVRTCTLYSSFPSEYRLN